MKMEKLLFGSHSVAALQLAEDMATKTKKKTPPETAPSLISNDKLQQMYSTMLKCRILESRFRNIGGRSVLKGKEAAAVGAAIDLRPEDALVFPSNAVVAAFLKGTPLRSLLDHHDQLASKREKKKWKMAPSTGLDVQSALATGIAFARGTGKTGHVTVAFLSQHPGLSKAGHEALRFAEAQKLPIIYVNIGDPSEGIEAEAYGFPVIPVDGRDVVAVYRVAHECIIRARQGGGPCLIACKDFSTNESAKTSQDPLRKMEKYLSAKNLFTNEQKQRIAQSFEKEIEQAIKAARQSAGGGPAASSRHVFIL